MRRSDLGRPIAALAAVALLVTALPPTLTAGPLPTASEDDGPWPNVIQPGAHLYEPGCPMAFLYRNTTGAWFGSTAGHCVDHVGQPVRLGYYNTFFWENRTHPVIGTVVAYRDDPSGRPDWALIELDPPEGVRIEPTLRHWTGPTGVLTGTSVDHYQDRVCYFGYGEPYENHDATRSRCGRLQGFQNRGDNVDASFRGPIYPGDSGSPIIHYPSGRALAMALSSLFYPTNRGVTVCSFLHMTADAGYNLTLATADYDPPRPWPTVANPALQGDEDRACPT